MATLALEHNGDMYACDHEVDPDHKLGNIFDPSMLDLIASPKERRFGRAKLEALSRSCRDCVVRFVCNGGCPKNRFATTKDGEYGLNYLCRAYKKYFAHIAPYMEEMTRLLQEKKPPAKIMEMIKQGKLE